MFISAVQRSLAVVIVFTLLMLIFSAMPSQAEPWVDTGDEQTRHHLQMLADSGQINIPLTSWPVMLRDLSSALENINVATLSPVETESFWYLQQILLRGSRGLAAGQAFYASSRMPGFTDFATDSREQLESRTYVTWDGGRFSGKLQVSAVGDDIDGRTWRADGSYLAAGVGNWLVGLGAVDRWWGPGWQSSLILSNAARPTPGVFVNRMTSKPFEWPVLKWLGPWNVQAFFNELEGDRPSANAKLFGFRTTFKPHHKVELGLSRTAQWGGEGRPQDWTSLRKMLIGRSNRGTDGNAEDGSDEPANQLAGYDWRISHRMGGRPVAFYGQLIGEDEAHSQPYKFVGLLGLETVIRTGTAHHRFMFEASNTTMEFYKYRGGTPNVAYEHPRYPAGYRYRGRPLGASTDNDSENYQVKGLHEFPGGRGLNWTLGRAIVNADGRNQSAPGGNIFTLPRLDTWYATAQYRMQLKGSHQLRVGGQFYERSLAVRGQTVGSGIWLGYEYWLP